MSRNFPAIPSKMADGYLLGLLRSRHRTAVERVQCPIQKTSLEHVLNAVADDCFRHARNAPHRADGIDVRTPCGHNGNSFGRRFVSSHMNLFRTIPRFVRLLVALFLVAQFAGVVSSPRAGAQPIAAASQGHHQHGHDHGGPGKSHHHGDQGGTLADTCCALHAYFAGVLPPIIAIKTGSIVSEPLALGRDDQNVGVPPGRLDRPPRPQR